MGKKNMKTMALLFSDGETFMTIESHAQTCHDPKCCPSVVVYDWDELSQESQEDIDNGELDHAMENEPTKFRRIYLTIDDFQSIIKRKSDQIWPNHVIGEQKIPIDIFGILK